MTKFIGEYKARIDDKGRLVFPSAFKALMDSDEPMRLVVKKNLYSPCLDIYTYREWERESEDIKSRLNFFNPEHSTFWRGYMSGRAVVEPDGKLGRITIPRQLLESIGARLEGHRFGLGTSLFSEEKTLCESYGASLLNEEFQKRQPFYQTLF